MKYRQFWLIISLLLSNSNAIHLNGKSKLHDEDPEKLVSDDDHKLRQKGAYDKVDELSDEMASGLTHLDTDMRKANKEILGDGKKDGANKKNLV